MTKDEFLIDMEKLEIVEVSTGNRCSIYDSGMTLKQIQGGMEYLEKRRQECKQFRDNDKSYCL